MRDRVLSMWTVYDHPKDFPNSFVARRFQVGPGGTIVVTKDTIATPDLDTLRKILLDEMRLTCLTRNDEDDAKIVETWL